MIVSESDKLKEVIQMALINMVVSDEMKEFITPANKAEQLKASQLELLQKSEEAE